MTVVLTLVQTKQIRINIHKPKIQKNSTNNTKHSKYKYTYYQNTHTLQNPHITKQVKQLQYKLKQTQYKIYPNEIITIKSCTLSIRSP